MKEIIQKLIKENKTISTMESCTGGFIANEITNISGSSLVFKFGAVTYSNEYKEKLGVPKDIIEKYSVYSKKTAKEMSKKISDYTNSDYGIGVTGKLNKKDPNNKEGKDNEVFISIYEKKTKKYIEKNVLITSDERKKAKQEVYEVVLSLLKEVIK